MYFNSLYFLSKAPSHVSKHNQKRWVTISIFDMTPAMRALNLVRT
jgi:hypothetical protein